MRTPPNGKQGTPGTNQRTQALASECNRDERNRHIVARHILADAAYVNAPCVDCETASMPFVNGKLALCDVHRAQART